MDHSPLQRPLIVFDGDCGFCRWWVARWCLLLGDRVDAQPYQAVVQERDDVNAEACAQGVHLIEPDGRISAGAEAVWRIYDMVGGWRRAMLLAHRGVPGFSLLGRVGYKWVADHRNTADGARKRLIGNDPGALLGRRKRRSS